MTLGVSGLTKHIKGRAVLADLSFTLPAGSVTGLVGRIGAGKTTMLCILAGLRHPTSGTAGLDDGPLPLGLVAFVDQAASLPRRLHLGELGLLGSSLHAGFDRARYRALLEEAGLSPRLRIARLSDGQRKLVAIAAALARHPRLLLLDEPLASLDPLTRRQALGEVLATAHEEGTIVIVSSHLVSDLERDCDHLLALHGGQLVLAAPIDELVRCHAWCTGDPPPGATLITRHGARALVRLAPCEQDRDAAVDLESLVSAYLSLAPEKEPACS